MSSFPHSYLFLGTSRTVVISGPHIQVLETKTGKILHSTANFDGELKDGILKSGHVRCAAVDTCDVHLATSGDDKVLKVWTINGLELLSSRELPKKPTGVRFLHDAQTILVSDKFGDIFSYPLHPIPNVSAQSEQSGHNSLTSHENSSGGTLILGHTSVLTSFVLSSDERYVISADRDEHVRVSWYPQGWNVEMFCLGHEKYVSSVHIPRFSPDTLISGGGDPTFKTWNWMTGKVHAEVEVWSAVQRYIKVEGGRKGRGWDEGADQGKQRMRRGKAKDNDINEEGGDVKDDIVDVGPSKSRITPDEPRLNAAEPGEIVQVVHKIDSFESNASKYILFGAVGATAIFMFPFPSVATTPLRTSNIRHFDFGRPVVDFVIGNDDLIWVLLDGQWGDSTENRKMVRVVRWDSVTEELKEADESHGGSLLISLNSSCLVPATPADLISLDLYARLSSMPKNSSEEVDGASDRTPQKGKNKNKNKGQRDNQPAATKRELGRLKNKMALARAVEKSMGGEGQDDEGADQKLQHQGEGRENKRPRSEGGTTQAEEPQDVLMDG